MSKHLDFKFIEQKPKTKVFAVISIMHGNRLGTIKWFGRRRQYAFFPENNTVWNIECLNDIQEFIKELKNDRKTL
jgi:hypothetical protein